MNQVIQGNTILSTVPVRDPAAHFALLGSSRDGQTLQWPLGNDQLSRHMLLLGGIGTGKSNAFNHIIRSVRRSMTPNDVMVIFDTKGDFYNEFYQPGDVVISNDERADGGRGPDYWNIFNEVNVDDRLEENLLEICKTIFAEKLEKTSQPFFPNAAKDLLNVLMLYLSREEKASASRNNQALRQLLNSMTAEKLLSIVRYYPETRAMESYISDPKSGQTLGVLAELQQMVREIFIGNFAKNGTLSVRRLIREKGARVIFIEYDLGIGGMLTPVYKLLMDLAIKEALCRRSNEGNVYFMIDEFRLLPHLEHIDDGVNFGRSLGAKFFIGVQNIEQVFHAYGSELARSILSGFSTLLAFRVTDGATRDFIKETFGRNITVTAYESSVSSRGMTEHLRETNVVEDWDIAGLQLGEAIVGYSGYPPFRFKFRKYD